MPTVSAYEAQGGDGYLFFFMKCVLNVHNGSFSILPVCLVPVNLLTATYIYIYISYYVHNIYNIHHKYS